MGRNVLEYRPGFPKDADQPLGLREGTRCRFSGSHGAPIIVPEHRGEDGFMASGQRPRPEVASLETDGYTETVRRTLILMLAAVLQGAALQERRLPGKARPPEAADCPRDKLTAYIGRVAAYARTPKRIVIEIETDWESREKAELHYSSEQDVTRWFLFRGEPFRPEHWSQIEERPGRLRKGVRAAVWVCEDGGNPLIDWEPPREGN
jgi:hypothetical protein